MPARSRKREATTRLLVVCVSHRTRDTYGSASLMALTRAQVPDRPGEALQQGGSASGAKQPFKEGSGCHLGMDRPCSPFGSPVRSPSGPHQTSNRSLYATFSPCSRALRMTRRYSPQQWQEIRKC